MKRLAILAVLALPGCALLQSGELPAGVMNSGLSDVAGTASIPGTVNLSFQCSGSLSQQGPAPTANAVRANAVVMPTPAPQPWPIPPAPPPFPPLPG